ncbi:MULTISPECIES: 3-demethoxyubiquinol 3-hydroxylase [Tenebrionibacter/Tenebrionicola group]|jgi:2-octaprenyl-3-methyl-6-methoxy-1,4-benzoquinol hydroxylase|uniref:2-octaprenyl-3-methyl-6-methoxy-1,4-benzoquinol hydroxylase n=2 Tax=Tenebrionibacter/Tenebrionicola group TaxID=2969848 RepID=A0A8K0V3S6_9ENTR|nr:MULTISPECIES: 3-demethoxyubiquinol 3-hydroxylase [Tenebrionibacter/Tenebrionicola group]MBK4714650.1 2-octaprenyl-3-methyl-6-methoxy-1,4-benzoquinol hydroxylase [Tenebrionibacter intestinalis]MBV4412380.1 2-octaprenyl-3-methyl-6-methoxy-1,4-benzoquinol hydroxylase [Tenebrionicola larvae]MBV5095120.1 2-octaprenyl-3-methyl-6-methoxy-1,4-benzoquinol hydroxylase [Tenebrionicola larvae]
MANQSIEVAVVGSGMVGGAVALGLAQRGFRVVVVEHDAPCAFNAASPPDVRVSAISRASVDLLKSLGVWQQVRAMRCHPYRRLETWEWESAHVVFDAAELRLPELGFMVENTVLQYALWQALEAHPQVQLRSPATLTAMHSRSGGHELMFDNGDTLTAQLVIGADGACSRVRAWAGIGVHAWEYRQSCLLITVRCEHAPGDSTWQHFTPSGPHAFLPLFDHWASLVWYDAPARIRQLQAMTMPQLKNAVAAAFPARLGEVDPIASGAFSLTRRHAMRYVNPGLALVGDAAHTIHPLAGQGVNLGYRDARALLEVLGNARDRDEEWHGLPVLTRYQNRRMPDNYVMQSGMDLLCNGFSHSLAPVRVLRNLGLMAAQRAGALKRQALKYALGL